MKAYQKFSNMRAWLSSLAVIALAMTGGVGFAQSTLPVANFDTTDNTDGFAPAIPPDFTNTMYLEHNQVNGIGNTSGPGALRVEFGKSADGNSGWAMRLDMNSTENTAAFNSFSQVAADESLWFLEFDTTVLGGEWGDPNLVDPGSLFQLNVAVNSDTGLGDLGGFQQKGDVLSNLNFRNNDAGGTFTGRIPMTSLPVSTGSTFYQLNIGASTDPLFDTSGGEGIDLYFDNFRFTQAPPTVEATLFSWETPDNPATTDIDERFEGWSDLGLNDPGDRNTTVHSIVNRADLGVPEDWGTGERALQIHRIDPADASSFHWGSNFALSSDDGNGGTVPAIQERIDEMKDLINGSSFIAFDLRFDDSFPNAPTFTRLAIYFTDGTGAFFNAEGDAIGAVPIGTTGTYLIPTNIINDANGSGVLNEVGLADSNFLGIGIATNTDGPGLYQIDNFRVITEIVSTPGDFDEDGDVDGRDFLLWQRDPSVGSLADWQANYGAGGLNALVAATSAVPEPATLMMLTVACTFFGLRRN